MSPYTNAWLVAFVWTCAIELPIYAVLLRRRFHPWWGTVCLALLTNTSTHPLLWFAFPHLQPYGLWLVTAEGLVWFVEALLSTIALCFFGTPTTCARALVLGASTALLANAVSTAIGLLVSF